MLTNLLLALEITALGMGLVFAAIILLWLMMWALTAVPSRQPDENKPDMGAPLAQSSTPPDLTGDLDFKMRAAAVAVAVALAEQSQSTVRPLSQPPTTIVSAWQLGMRTRQMYEKGEKR